MLRPLYKISTILAILLAAQSCAPVLSPYETEFSCPQAAEGGTCGKTAIEVHDEIVDGQNKPQFADPSQGIYQKKTFERMTRMLEDPREPRLLPARSVRILFVASQSEDGLSIRMPRFEYLLVEGPRWVLANPLLGNE